jgi:hypothetical protein
MMVSCVALMPMPPKYAAWLQALGFTEISFGYAGIKLLLPEEFDDGQTGYSISAEGQSFCDGKEGSWRAEWLVIGYDTSLGDPIILDTSNSTIMSAMHGEGAWEPFPIASSLQAFAFALNAIKNVSPGRENPVPLESNPLPEIERKKIVQSISNANGEEINLEFWELMLASGLPLPRIRLRHKPPIMSGLSVLKRRQIIGVRGKSRSSGPQSGQTKRHCAHLTYSLDEFVVALGFFCLLS